MPAKTYRSSSADETVVSPRGAISPIQVGDVVLVWVNGSTRVQKTVVYVEWGFSTAEFMLRVEGDEPQLRRYAHDVEKRDDFYRRLGSAYDWPKS